MMLHWSIALLLAYNYGLGLKTEDSAAKADLFAIYQLHKSVGISILLLTLVRVWIRVTRPRPMTLMDDGWAKTVSSLVHGAFYVIMIGMPLTGWIIVSTSDIKVPTMIFGVIPWPDLPISGLAPWIGKPAVDAHELIANAALGLVALHLAGVVRHQFALRDNVVSRMAPVARHGAAFIILAVALLGGSFLFGRYGPPQTVLNAPAASPPLITGGQPSPPPTAAQKAAEPLKETDPTQPATDLPGDTAAAANRPVDEWTVRPGGRLGFGLRVNGEQVTGRFGRWDSSIAFDPARPELAAINVRIALATATTGDSQRDAMLQEGDFFDTTSQPTALFKSTSVRALGNNRYAARGILTIKGAALPATISFSLQITGDTAEVAGGTAIQRNDFLVGVGQWAGADAISHKVDIAFKFSARRKPAAEQQ